MSILLPLFPGLSGCFDTLRAKEPQPAPTIDRVDTSTDTGAKPSPESR